MEDFSRAEFGFTYGGEARGETWLEFYFGGDEEAARRFYASYRAEFNTMRRPDMPRELWHHAHKPGRRHFLWWAIESPEPPAFDSPYDSGAEAEFRQLARLGVLRAEEIEALTAEAIEADRQLHFSPWHHGLPFRRSWQFWAFVSPEPRDESILESAQLTRMGALTSLEKAIIADPMKAVTSGMGGSARTRYYYLPREERRLLGLDHYHILDDEADGTSPTANFPSCLENASYE